MKKITFCLVVVVAFISFILNVDATNTRSVYFTWLDGENSFHYVKLNDIERASVSEMPTNYIPIANLKDENNVYYQMGQDYEFVSLNNGSLNFTDFIEGEGFISSDNKLEYLHDNDFTINPAIASNYEHSIITNGDMDFRIIVYDTDYDGATIKSSGDNNLRPDFLGGIFYTDTFDITSGVSKNHPAVLESYLLNDTVTLEASEVSSNFTSVTALDVPNDAVNITKSGNKFTIKFNSNYYDRVVFKVETADSETYYVMIARVAMKVYEERENHEIRPTIYYKATNTYSDYQLIANITYKNNTKEIKVLNPETNGINDQNTDPFVNEMVGDIQSGTNSLKKCQFKISNSNNIKEVKFTVIRANSLNNNVYLGTFTGSSDGLVFKQINQYEKRVEYYEGEYNYE